MTLDASREFWNPEIELMPRSELRELQLRKLKRQLKYNYENSIFYKESFDRAGIKPEDIQTFENFLHLPIMTKDDQRRCQEDSLERFGHPYGMLTCAPVEKIIRISATSGTTGMPTLYTLTRHDVSVVRELHARRLWRMGFRPGHIVLHALALSMFTGGMPTCDAMQEYGVCVVPVGAEGGVTRVLQFIDLCKPHFLRCTPTFAEYLIQKCPEVLGKPARVLGLKGIAIGGEPGGGIPEVRKRIKEGFNVEMLFDSIGGTHNFHGYSCPADPISYQGMHLVSEDYCVLELLDTETQKSLELKDGVIGEMCYTYIDWEGSPLLRYRLGDILQIFLSPCKCGDPRMRFKIIGRSDDMLIVKGVNLYPAALKNLVASFIPRVTGEMRIILDEPGPRVTPPLKIQVEYGEGFTKGEIPSLNKEMREKMHNLLRVTPDIELVPPHTLERSTHKTKLFLKRYEKREDR
ncbi:MAG: phenylacetate--CoA ligase family protein [Deltaproteobacteria bacterium]|nr:phenylacetate--CoA ligase family protein [Deltaproteobacteria bacterium]